MSALAFSVINAWRCRDTQPRAVCTRLATAIGAEEHVQCAPWHAEGGPFQGVHSLWAVAPKADAYVLSQQRGRLCSGDARRWWSGELAARVSGGAEGRAPRPCSPVHRSRLRRRHQPA